MIRNKPGAEETQLEGTLVGRGLVWPVLEAFDVPSRQNALSLHGRALLSGPNRQHIDLEQIKIQGQQLDLEAQGSRTSQQRWTGRVHARKLGPNRFSVEVRHDPHRPPHGAGLFPGLSFDVSGESLYLESALGYLRQEQTPDAQPDAPEDTDDTDDNAETDRRISAYTQPPFCIEGQFFLETLVGASNLVLNQNSGTMLLCDSDWKEIRFRGEIGGKSPMIVAYDAVNPYDRSFSAEGSNVGFLLFVLGFGSDLGAGQFVVDMASSSPLELLRGEASVEDLQVLNPNLALRISAFLSIDETLASFEDTLTIRTLKTDMRWSPEKLYLDYLDAEFQNNKMLAQGEIDIQNQTVAVSGVFTTVRSFHTFFERIYALDRLIIGPEGSLLLGTPFRATGPLSQPNFEVDYLDSFLPGILKYLRGTETVAPTPDAESSSQSSSPASSRANPE